jgi:hypothetical protein
MATDSKTSAKLRVATPLMTPSAQNAVQVIVIPARHRDPARKPGTERIKAAILIDTPPGCQAPVGMFQQRRVQRQETGLAGFEWESPG